MNKLKELLAQQYQVEYVFKYMTKYIKTKLHNRAQCMELIYIINGIDYIDNSDIIFNILKKKYIKLINEKLESFGE